MEDQSELQQREQLYSEARRELLARQMANSDGFDKLVLSLSTGFLALSVTLLKVGELTLSIEGLYLLRFSWVAFGVAIVAAALSYPFSQSGIRKQLRFAEEYYLNGQEEYLRKRNWQAGATDWLNTIAGFAFAVAVALTIAYGSARIGG